jgi:hypothetical protein
MQYHAVGLVQNTINPLAAVPLCNTALLSLLCNSVATMILYCKAADVGGGTTFSNVDVFVQAKR